MALRGANVSRVKGSSESTQMILLTIAGIGLCFCWGTEMTYASPYLLSLGLSKSKLSLVWVAGPLSGLVMQPIIGMMSDKSTSRFGRRRPFMMLGTVLVVVCFIILGWTAEIVGAFVLREELKRDLTIALAVVDIFVLDFVINIAQSTCRALVVDTLPVEKQQLGAAWCSRMGGVGSMLMYGIGSLDLDGIFGNSYVEGQFKKVCLVAAIAMVLAQGTTCWAVTEKVYVPDEKEKHTEQTLSATLKQIYARTLHLPENIQAICRVQFWSWIGWFPFGFYGSTWVGEIYLRHEAPSASKDALTDVGRHGSTAFIICSIIGFVCAIFLPWFIRSPDDDDKTSYTPRPPQALEPAVGTLRKNKPSLLTAWKFGCLLFSASMIFAPFVHSVRAATLLIALCGISKTVAEWAPGAFLGVEVNRMSNALPTSHNHSRKLSNEGSEMVSPRESLLRRDSDVSPDEGGSSGELSGVYFGILNIYTTLPQFVGTGISWVVFSILEPGKSPELSNSKLDKQASSEALSGIAVCLFIGACCSLMAAYSTKWLKIS
ncbi:general alpha-glucoside permease-like [Teratosphaeria destructans]|uniref:General alpha-glucoside permease-like n=1 Tax=Teratosphaeria destructans TaxID=418781 RepID=A0A9W7W3B8_9PEZI|nr:general alpha-glucoside permease-like [Teratosphaeria destructans]